MIGSLRGIVVEAGSGAALIDVGGVGYTVAVSEACLNTLVPGSECSLVIHTDVREDAIRLYGFADRLEKQVFLLLLQVKGVGARSASDIVSAVDKRELLRLIAAGDLHKLQSVKRIGKKTAERIVVELRDKVGEYALEGQSERMGVERLPSGALQDAIGALESLGFSRSEAEHAVKQVQRADMPGMDASQIVKEALRYV